MNISEIVGVIFGLICVWLTAKKSVWSWPIGIINVFALIVTFYNSKLYPDMGLHVVYLILGVYGWFHWGQIKNDLPVTKIKSGEITVWMILTPFLIWAMGSFFYNYTQAAAPYVDSTITVISLIANWYLCRKVLENWIIWMIVDVIAVSLYTYKGLYFMSGLYSVYFIICIKGYLEWKKELQQA